MKVMKNILKKKRIFRTTRKKLYAQKTKVISRMGRPGRNTRSKRNCIKYIERKYKINACSFQKNKKMQKYSKSAF